MKNYTQIYKIMENLHAWYLRIVNLLRPLRLAPILLPSVSWNQFSLQALSA